MMKMVILDQSKPISLYFKNKKNSKIRNLLIARLLFIKTEIRQVYKPILKSNSTFMFNKKFCEMKGEKVKPLGGAWGNGGTIQIASWKCNFGIYLDIQAITTLYAFYWLFMCWFLLFVYFSTLQLLS